MKIELTYDDVVRVYDSLMERIATAEGDDFFLIPEYRATAKKFAEVLDPDGEPLSDREADRYASSVQNGYGYYTSDGRYQPYSDDSI